MPPLKYWSQFSWSAPPDNPSELWLNDYTMCDTVGDGEPGFDSPEAILALYCRYHQNRSRRFAFRVIAADERPKPVGRYTSIWGPYTPVTRFILFDEPIDDITPYLLQPPFIDKQDNLETTMPETPTPIQPDLTHGPDSLVRAKIVRDMSNARLTLVLDAKPLHDLLERMGVKHDGTSFAGRPGSRYTVASPDFQVQTEALLTRRYPASFNLSGIWTEPPTIPQLKKLGESIHTAVRKILEHYRPIDISFNLVKVAADAPKTKERK